VETGGTQPCPSCGATLPVVPPYLTWCHECGWNLKAAPRPLPTGRFDRMYEEAGRRAGRRLARELAAADKLEPRLTTSKALAYAIAAAVHLATLLLLVGGGVLIALFPSKIFAVAAGVLMIAVAVLVRPRFGKVPDEDLVSRSQAPTLFRLCDRVAAEVGTKTVDVLVVDDDYNAAWAILGLRRKRVLRLGLPLIAVLEPQDRAGVVAHELAHARNGDSSRGLFVGSAIRGLAHWYVILSPHRTSGVGTAMYAPIGLAERVANVFLWLLSRPPLLLFRLEVTLLLQDSRRAEYLADALAAQVAGTDAVVATHEKLLLEGSFEQAVRRFAQPSSRGNEAEVFDAVRAELDAVPQRERDRRRRVALLEASRLGATHPPTGQRIRLLEQRPAQPARVTLTAAESDEIDRELSGLRASLGRRLVENQRSRLYQR
jgi:Zn-dependent protease with chaperone function